MLAQLRHALDSMPDASDVPTQLQKLVELDLDKLPMPSQGETLQRWRALALVASHNLSLAKQYEGHTDALAILAELGDATKPTGAVWGVWAAESANTRVIITQGNGTSVQLNGTKCWCSGAQTLSHGLLTAWHADGRGPQLVRVAMHQPGVSVFSDAWHAVGMADSASVDVTFSHAQAQLVGQCRDYTTRPGFWQGSAGIAACWYGGALFLGQVLHQTLSDLATEARGAFRLAALGKVDLALHSTAAVLRDAAQRIDNHPLADARATALRARLAAEECARQVLDETGKALGAAAFCRHAQFARMAADLPVFVRQSHAERDYTALAENTLLREDTPWSL